MNYIKNIWITRYFWINLALSDIRSKWRRSFFGVLWTIIQPLGMTILLSVVFSKIFNTDATSYAPYILSGMIVWEFITQALMSGSMSFIQADAYIKQYKTPLAIYTLRAILTNLITLLLASISLITWALITNPQNFNYSWFAAFLIYPILLLISWPLSTILAYLTARFRDIPYALTLALQAVWFISPVYIQDTVFRSSGLNSLIDYNREVNKVGLGIAFSR